MFSSDEPPGATGPIVAPCPDVLKEPLPLIVIRPYTPAVGPVPLPLLPIKRTTPPKDKREIEMDYETAMNMIRAGQMLPAKQTIDLASENLRMVSVWSVFVSAGSRRFCCCCPFFFFGGCCLVFFSVEKMITGLVEEASSFFDLVFF